VRAFLLITSIIAACGGGKIKAPQSDKNFDDSDDPGSMMTGTIGGRDGSSDGYVPDAEGKSCMTPADCPAPLRCIFPIALLCSAKGMCALYTDPPNCAQNLACNCDNKTVSLCTPDGYAPAPISKKSACTMQDASVDAPSDASSDAADGALDASLDVGLD
jgi:hypothetical protein